MRLLGIPTTDELESAHSEEELRLLVHRSRGVGLLEAAEEEMIGKVFDFADTEVRQVMVPRPDVVALPIGLDPGEAMEQVLRHPYTRYPVYDGDLDDIVGILHVRTLFGASQNGGAASTDLRELIRPAHTVPETKRLADLLGEFRRTKSHMAIVVDEYGSLAGIATLEDLIEEIVGDIADEFDLPETAILRLGRDRLRIEGSFPIEDFNERFGALAADRRLQLDRRVRVRRARASAAAGRRRRVRRHPFRGRGGRRHPHPAGRRHARRAHRGVGRARPGRLTQPSDDPRENVPRPRIARPPPSAPVTSPSMISSSVPGGGAAPKNDAPKSVRPPPWTLSPSGA